MDRQTHAGLHDTAQFSPANRKSAVHFDICDADDLNVYYSGTQGMGAQLKAAPHLDRFFYDLPTTSKKRNIHAMAGQDLSSMEMFNLRGVFGERSPLVEDFVYSQEHDRSGPISTFYVVGDLDTLAGINLCRSALQHLQVSTDSFIEPHI